MWGPRVPDVPVVCPPGFFLLISRVPDFLAVVLHKVPDAPVVVLQGSWGSSCPAGFLVFQLLSFRVPDVPVVVIQGSCCC